MTVVDKSRERTLVCTRVSIVPGVASDGGSSDRVPFIDVQLNPAGEIFLGELLLILAAVVFFSAWFVGTGYLLRRHTAHSGRADIDLGQIEADLGGRGHSTMQDEVTPLPSSGTDDKQTRSAG